MVSLNINDKAIEFLKKNKNKINWTFLCSNTNPNVIEILKENKDKIYWFEFSANPIIFELDYVKMNEYFDKIKEEIIIEAMNPKRIVKYLEMENYDYLEEMYGY